MTEDRCTCEIDRHDFDCPTHGDDAEIPPLTPDDFFARKGTWGQLAEILDAAVYRMDLSARSSVNRSLTNDQALSIMLRAVCAYEAKDVIQNTARNSLMVRNAFRACGFGGF
jgi:hypothetical protein